MSDEPENDEPYRVPIAFWWGDHPVPELASIPQERWRTVLRQVPDHIRHRAARRLPQPDSITAIELWLELAGEDRDRETAMREKLAFPAPLPSPSARQARLSRQHQICFRLTPMQHTRAAEVASELGLRPAQLARLLTLRGVAQISTESEARGG